MVRSPRDLIFRLDEWPDCGLDLDLNLPAATLTALLTGSGETPPLVTSSLRGRLRLDLSGRRLLVRGRWSVAVEALCDRCLNPTALEIGSAVDESLILGEGEALIPGLDDKDSPDFWPVISGAFDLAPFVVEMFWLAWPFRVICREECLGLCPSCGADLNLGRCACIENVH